MRAASGVLLGTRLSSGRDLASFPDQRKTVRVNSASIDYSAKHWTATSLCMRAVEMASSTIFTLAAIVLIMCVYFVGAEAENNVKDITSSNFPELLEGEWMVEL